MTIASALEYRSRYELVEEARALGVERPERMTMQELKDEILRLSLSEEEQPAARGLFGVARAMLASVVEAGLKMPDAAKVIRGDVTLDLPVRSRSPVATVTLAEIYAAQGHRARALSVLDEVLAVEPDHEEARRIQGELLSGEGGGRPAGPSASSDAVGAGGETGPIVDAEASARVPAVELPPTPPPEIAPRSAFPSTEYVPLQVVDTTGHEVALTPAPAPVDRALDRPADAVPEASDFASDAVPEASDFASDAVPASDFASDAVPEASDLAAETVGDDPLASGREGAPADQAEPLLVTERRGTSLLIYWELPPEVVRRSGLTEGEGKPAVVVVAFTPSGPRPVRDQRTTPLAWQAPHAGALIVPDLAPQAAVRAAVGWLLEDSFLPLAVGRSLERWASDSPAVAGRAASALDLLPV